MSLSDRDWSDSGGGHVEGLLLPLSEAESLAAMGRVLVSSGVVGNSEMPDVSMSLLPAEWPSTALSVDPKSAEEGGTIVISASPDGWPSVGLESDGEGAETF